MKKSNIIGMILIMLSMAIPAMGAMSSNEIRKNSRFLTDRMAHELNLSIIQYEDVYEVNYDFLHNVRYLLDDVARGIPRAIDKYYDYLDIRNDDLRWILSNNQYRRFINEDYFYRPVYAQNNRWQLRIYFVYTNINFFYFGKPKHYTSYKGRHFRTYHNNMSFYQQRYNQRYKHDVFKGNYFIKNNPKRYEENKKHDFGPNSRPSVSRPANTKPSTSRPANTKPSTSRPANNSSSTSRPESTKPSTSRPANNSSSTSRPENTKPSTSRPANNNSSTSRPEGTKPSTSRPANNNTNSGKVSSSKRNEQDNKKSNPRRSSSKENASSSNRSNKTEK